MAVGPAPLEHQVVYTTLHFDHPSSLDNYVKTAATKRGRRSSRRNRSGLDRRRIEEERAARARRRRFSDRPEMVVHAAQCARPEVYSVQFDESEPGTCKDRDILRFNPHA
jgi:NADH-quinone oxidoreductase subunit F